MLAKIDIQSAFRILPVHPADRHLLLMKWNGNIYVDMCLPFGLRSAPKLFNVLADLLEWIARAQGLYYILHYLDDFLMVGPPMTHTCQHNLDTMIRICEDLGVPLAIDKVEGPSSSLPFLGIMLDTNMMEARLPQDKLNHTFSLVTAWLKKKKATKRDILSLVGSLQHASKVVHCSRPFLSRMYATAARVRELDYYTCLNKEFRSDLHWWHTFLISWNGLSLFRSTVVAPKFHIYTDASGS